MQTSLRLQSVHVVKRYIARESRSVVIAEVPPRMQRESLLSSRLWIGNVKLAQRLALQGGVMNALRPFMQLCASVQIVAR
jgi:hypothetical protein